MFLSKVTVTMHSYDSWLLKKNIFFFYQILLYFKISHKYMLLSLTRKLRFLHLCPSNYLTSLTFFFRKKNYFKKYSLIRSPHVYKNSMEQFSRITKKLNFVFLVNSDIIKFKFFTRFKFFICQLHHVNLYIFKLNFRVFLFL